MAFQMKKMSAPTRSAPAMMATAIHMGRILA